MAVKQSIAVIIGVLAAAAVGGRSESGSGSSEAAAPMADTIARVFAPGVISRGHEFMASFSPDGRTVYFCRRIFERPGDQPRLTILESRLIDGRWTEPVVAPFSGRWRDIDPVVSPDGRQLYFNSTRPAPGRDSTRTDFDVWIVDREADGWGAPRRLDAPINTARSEYFASVTRDGTLYFTLAGDRPRESVIVRARSPAKHQFAAPETLSVVNEPPPDAGNPFIAADESYLLFVARRPEGFGDSDIYISRREGQGWSRPRNLGARVNTPLAEFAPSVSPDGRTLYFTRMSRGEFPPVKEENVMSIPLAAVGVR